jgi:hypothetical protein
MRKLMITGIVAVGLGLIAYSRVHAQEAPTGPPPQGMTVIIKQPMIQCDKQDQIKQIAAAMLISDKAAADKIDEYHAIIDKDGEPNCVFGAMQFPATAGESVALPDIKLGDTDVSAWCIHLGTSKGEWYALYIVPKTKNQGTSI